MFAFGRRLACSWMGLAVCACGGDDGAGVGADAEPEVTAQDAMADDGDAAAPDVAPPEEEVAPSDALDSRDYCELTVDVFCPYYLRCGRMAVDDLEACRAVFLETCNERYEPIYAALAERGELSLSRAGIERCGDHLASVACAEQIFDLDGGCDAVWVGGVSVQGACAPGIESFVCEAATTCVVSLDFCGRCVPLATGAEPCDLEHRCREDEVCRDGKCVARPRVGEQCDGSVSCVLGADCLDGICGGPEIVALGDGCDARRRCPYAAACVSGRCQASALLGAACDAAGCASGVCEDGICQHLGDPGATCERGAQCRSGRCEAGSCGRLTSACLD